MDTDKKVYVIGGITGGIGQALAQRLLQAGHLVAGLHGMRIACMPKGPLRLRLAVLRRESAGGLEVCARSVA